MNDEIVLEGKTVEGYPEKWIFSQITPQSIMWHSVETRDDGKNLDAYGGNANPKN